MNPHYAVIDIGTLKVKLLIAEVSSSGQIKPIHKSNTLTCFGVEIDQNNGNVKTENLQRTIQELQKCKQLLDQHQVTKYKIVSTHAMRRAKNRTHILQQIKNQTDFNVKNISDQDEARLFFLAVMRGFPSSNQKYAVVDMGGGSVQILIGKPDQLQFTHSMKTGAAYLHDNFTRNSNSELSFTTETELEKMRNYILEQLLPVERNIQTPIIYGSSNIIDLMQAIKLPLKSHNQSTTHPYKIYAQHLQKFIKKMTPLKYVEREELFNFQKGYLWGVDKAFLNLITLSEHLNSPYIIPSNSNIAEGIIHEMIKI